MTPAAQPFLDPQYEEIPGYGLLKPISDRVCAEYKMSFPAIVEGSSRTPTEARRVCCWLAKRLGLRLTYPEIATIFGRTRNMVERSVYTIEQRREKDAWLREMTDRLLTELRA